MRAAHGPPPVAEPLVTQAVLGVQDVVKHFGAQTILDNASLMIHEGDRIGLIGINGSGKSTLLRILAGLDKPEEGIVTRRQGLRVTLLRQQWVFPDGATVRCVLHDAVKDLRALERAYHEAAEEADGDAADSHARVDDLHHEMDVRGVWTLDHRIRRLTTELRLPEEDRTVETLSGGEARRLDLAAALLQQPDVLLLDEPTNHVDVESVRWLENFLASYDGTCILVTHDRYFLERVVNRIVELENARLSSYPGNYEVYLERKALRDSHDARTEQNRKSSYARELVWLRRGPKARATKQKARIGRAEELEEQIASRQVSREFRFAIPKPPRLGKQVVEARRLRRELGGKTLFDDFSFILQSGMRVGVVGANGSGKTTLLRVLMGLESPDAGEVITGDNTQFLYVDQNHEEVDPQQTIIQHISNGAEYMEVNGQRVYIPVYLEQFLFDRSTIRMPMENLSGGERNRVDIAKKLLRGGNVLVLDEPTNDLDLQTLRVLEEAVLAFDGCVLLVTHDRYFLNRVATHLIVFEEAGCVVQVAGNYDDYLIFKEYQAEEERRSRALQAPASPDSRRQTGQPRRLTWKEQRELEGMERAIGEAEEIAASLELTMGTPDFYRQSADQVQAVLREHEAAKALADTLYARWAELEAIARGEQAEGTLP
jgi:ABC transport system ATP-binding/permease protein